jgi:ATP-dependent helicase HrpA
LEISYPAILPISQRREEITDAIRENQVLVVAGETGSGKTTQLPKLCLEAGRGSGGMIGHTQPRRLAARTVAARIAEELGCSLGEQVGYQVRFQDASSDDTLIKLMTDGILLAEIQHDPLLSRYDTLIVDEAHERSLNIDFLLGYIKQLLPKRPDLKLIITSATIDVERFSRHFDQAPIIEVSGRTYPVEVHYVDEPALLEMEQAEAIVSTLKDIVSECRLKPGAAGDVLVFLAGEREIRETANAIRKARLEQLEVLPLYARLSHAEQARVFSTGKRGPGLRVVLATNVAETSLTVPGIRYVIDPGFARISRYSYRSKVQRLPVEAISRASADQRKGRCGRVSDGVCYRLYGEADFNGRPEFTDPEIQRTNLASVILKMQVMGLGDIAAFPFLEPPDRRQINDGFKLLQELGALDSQRSLTPLGRQLSRLSVDPRFGRMILAAPKHGCLREMLLITSALSVADPRERPADKQQAADQSHARFRQPESDFYSIVCFWDYYEEQRQQLSQNQLRKLCRKEFISFVRMREWRDIHRQLHLQCREMGMRENHVACDWQQVHKALLAGLLGHIGTRQEARSYLGARNRKFELFPGSALVKKPPRWVMSAELVETSRLFARTVGKIEPEWVLPYADHLVKREHYEPRWQARSGKVMAIEKISLYGLTLSDGKRVPYQPIDPVEARRIFIQGALVEQGYRGQAKFFHHNKALLGEFDELESRSRRRDILVDESQLFGFYDERVPETVCSSKQLDNWLRKKTRKDPEVLYLDRETVSRRTTDEFSGAQFPDFLRWQDYRLPLGYRFEPGHADDGVTVSVPTALLKQLPGSLLEWLVPGMLRDKCVDLLKGLPKPLRKQLVPVPPLVDSLLEDEPDTEKSLLEWLADGIRRRRGVTVEPGDWQAGRLDPHYLMNIRVLDADGGVLGAGRDIGLLRRQYQDQAAESLAEAKQDAPEKSGIKAWVFSELPETVEFDQAGFTVRGFPALVDAKDSVTMKCVDNREEADKLTRQGVVRLLVLDQAQSVKYLRKELFRQSTQVLRLHLLGSKEKLVESIIEAAFAEVSFDGAEIPRNQKQFNECVEKGRGAVVQQAMACEKVIESIVEYYWQVQQELKKLTSPACIDVVMDVKHQCGSLLGEGFVSRSGWQWLQQVPRYLQAILQRLESVQGKLARDAQLMADFCRVSKRFDDMAGEMDQSIFQNKELEQYYWLLQEYRVSLFAQRLGTSQPVSEKRLDRLWQEIKKNLGP